MPCDDSRIIGTDNGHHNLIAIAAIVRSNIQLPDDLLTLSQRLNNGCLVIELILPVAGTVYRKQTIFVFLSDRSENLCAISRKLSFRHQAHIFNDLIFNGMESIVLDNAIIVHHNIGRSLISCIKASLSKGGCGGSINHNKSAVAG